MRTSIKGLQLFRPRASLMLPVHLHGSIYNIHEQLTEVRVVMFILCTLSPMLNFDSLLRVLKRVLAPFRASEAG
jgi:hypothetical protein